MKRKDEIWRGQLYTVMYGIKTSRLFLSNLSEINRHLRKLSPVLHKPLKDAKKTTFNRNVRPQGETRATLSPQTYLYQMSSSSRESFGILKSKGGNSEISELWELGYKYRVRRVWRSAPKHNHRYQAVQIPTYGGATEETVVCIRTEPR